MTTVLLNCLSLSQFELARAILHQLVLSDPRHAISLAATLALHGPPPTWLCSASVPSSAHLAWLCAHELLHICRVVRALPAPPAQRLPPSGGETASCSVGKSTPFSELKSSRIGTLPTNWQGASSDTQERLELAPASHAPSSRLLSSFPSTSPISSAPGRLPSPTPASDPRFAAGTSTRYQADLSLTSIFPLWLLRRLHMDLILAQALLDCASHGTSILSVEVATELRVLHAVLLSCPLQAGNITGCTVAPPARKPRRVSHGADSLEGDRNMFGKGEDSSEASPRSISSMHPGAVPSPSLAPAAWNAVQESSPKQTPPSSFRPSGSSFSCLCPEVIHLPSLLLLPLPYTLPSSLSRLPACIVSRRNRLATYAQGSPVLSLDAVNQLSALMKSHPASALALFEVIGYVPASVLALGPSPSRAALSFLSADPEKSGSAGAVSSLSVHGTTGRKGRSRDTVVQGHAAAVAGATEEGRERVPADKGHKHGQRKAASQSPGEGEDAESRETRNGESQSEQHNRAENGQDENTRGVTRVQGEGGVGMFPDFLFRARTPGLCDSNVGAMLSASAICSITWEERDSTGEQRFVVDPASAGRSLCGCRSRPPWSPPQPVVLEPLYSPPWTAPPSPAATGVEARRPFVSLDTLKQVGMHRQRFTGDAGTPWSNVYIVPSSPPDKGTRVGEQGGSPSRRCLTERSCASSGTSFVRPPCRREGTGEAPPREGEESGDEAEDEGWVFLAGRATGAGYRLPGSRLLRTPISATSPLRTAAYPSGTNPGLQSVHPADKSYAVLSQPAGSFQTGELASASPRSTTERVAESANSFEDVANNFSTLSVTLRQQQSSCCAMQVRLNMEAAFAEGVDLFSLFFPSKMTEVVAAPTGLEACAGEVLIRVVRKLHQLHVGVAAEALLDKSRDLELSWDCTADGFSSPLFKSDAFHHLQRLDATAGILPLCAALSRPQLEYGYAQSLSLAFACTFRLLSKGGGPWVGGNSSSAVLATRYEGGGGTFGGLQAPEESEEEKSRRTSRFAVGIVDPLRRVRAELLRQSLQSYFRIVSLFVALYDDCKNERLLPRLRPLLVNLATLGVTSAVQLNRKPGTSAECPQVPPGGGGGAAQGAGVGGGGQNAPGGPTQGSQAGSGAAPVAGGTTSVGSVGHHGGGCGGGGGGASAECSAAISVDPLATPSASASEGGTWRRVGGVARQPNSILPDSSGTWDSTRAVHEADDTQSVQPSVSGAAVQVSSNALGETCGLLHHDGDRREEDTETGDGWVWEEGGVLRKCAWLDLNEARRCLTDVFEASMLPLLKEAEEARR